MDSIDLRNLIQPLFRWWWLLLLATVLAGISSFTYVSQQPLIYQSRTTLMVGSVFQDPNPDGNRIYLSQQLAATYADYAQRATIRQATMDALGMNWLPEYSARVSGQLLEVTVVDTDARRAQQVAQELARQLVLQSPSGQGQLGRQAFVEQRLQKMEGDISETELEIDRKKEELASELSASKIRLLQSEIEILETKVSTLQSTYAELLTTTQRGAANAIQIFEVADFPERPNSNGYLTQVFVAMIFGLVLAAGGVYLIEFLDNTIKTSKQVQQLVGLSTLGAIPILR